MKQKLLLTCACMVLITSELFAQIPTYYISPKAAVGANQSLFIDSLEFYPIKDGKDFKSNAYAYPFVANDQFQILSFEEKKFYIFSKEGRLIKMLPYGKLGQGANPTYDENTQQLIFFYPNKNYELTEKDMIQISADFSNPKNKKYFRKSVIDLNDSSYTYKKATPSAFDILRAYNLRDDYYCTYQIDVNPKYKDSLDYEVKIYKGENFVKGYFPYNKQKENRYQFAKGMMTGTFPTRNPKVFYISRPYLDTIYSLSDSVIRPAFKIVLPLENSLPKNFFEMKFKNATDRQNYESNNGWMRKQVFAIGFFIFF